MPDKLIPYEKLTRRGQIRRLRVLAWNALAQYDLQVSGLNLLGWFTNLMFRVITTDGQTLVLRICAPNWRTNEDRRAEVAWLLALADEPEIGAPVPQPARNGAHLVEARGAGTGACQCLLMSWTPGVNLGKHLNEKNLYKMGALFARLHDHGAAWRPPPEFTTRRMSRVLARDEPDVLFAEQSAEAFNPYTWLVWEKALQMVETAYASLYNRDGLQVIHHDLWHDNIKLHHGRLYPLDFEDTVWGYPIQDIAMAMQDLMSDVPSERYEPLLGAFRRGYETKRCWPEAYPGEMDSFRVGRMLWTANWVALHERQYLADHLGRNAPLLERFLDTGRLRKPSSS
jgi:Ser/Thr protein kinase RdoA (MazF antagonist)